MAKRIGIVVGLMLAGASARAAVPTELTVQGVLRDSAGKLQSSTVQVTVKFFDKQTGGNPIGATFGPVAAAAVNGLFSQPVTLAAGDFTALANAAQVWMEVTVGNDTFDRQKVSPELYALACRQS